MDRELFYTMALTRLTNFNYQLALELYRMVGNAQTIYEHRNDISDIVEDCSPRLIEALKDWDEPMRRDSRNVRMLHSSSTIKDVQT